MVMGPQGDQIRQYMLDGFKKAYPDITLEWQGGRNNEMAVKLEQERRGQRLLHRRLPRGHQHRPAHAEADRRDRPDQARTPPAGGDRSEELARQPARLRRQGRAELRLRERPLDARCTTRRPSAPTKWTRCTSWSIRSGGAGSSSTTRSPPGAGNVAFRFFWEVLQAQRAEEYMRTLKANAAAVTQDQRQQVEWLVRNRAADRGGRQRLSSSGSWTSATRCRCSRQFKDYGGLVTAAPAAS